MARDNEPYRVVYVKDYVKEPFRSRRHTTSVYREAKMEEYPSKQVPENLDDPPNSRLFVVTSRSITEDELRESFYVFGDIQGVWVVKDKQTKESKGIAYIKFAKSSQACLAMEEMHGKVLVEGTKPVKVTSMVRSPKRLYFVCFSPDCRFIICV